MELLDELWFKYCIEMLFVLIAVFIHSSLNLVPKTKVDEDKKKNGLGVDLTLVLNLHFGV